VGAAFTAVFALAFVAAIAASVYGWVNNILIIINTVDLPMTGMFVLRCVGILVAPLGIILGYM
jgi:hypothetical protein